jgi:superfamily II DNA or RNA helicase
MTKPLLKNIALRDYQAMDVNRLRGAFRDGLKAPLYVLSTGGGKTVIFSYITQQAAARGNRVLILVHRQELLRQSSESLESLGVEHGLIAPGRSMTGDPVQVASVQTLVRRLHKIVPPDLIIIDEAHHASAASWKKVIEAYPKAHLLGVTATPCRMDGKGLGTQAGGYFDTMIAGPSIRDLIDRGFLCPPKVYAPPTDFSTDGLHSRYGDFIKKEVAAAVDKPVITGSAVEHYRKICPGTPAIAFCASVAHAEHVAEEFRAAGFQAASVDGSMDDGRRKSLIRALGTGGLHVLASCDIISEGTDIPVVGAAILLRPTQSMGLFLQQVGRALRICPGKKHAIILDHVGNCLRHGMPDEVREWSLDGEDRKGASRGSQEVLERVKQCEQCYAVHAPAPRCPQCGFEYEDAGCAPEEVAGELQEIDEEQAELMKRQRRREVGRADTLEELQAIGRERGYKPGWARYIWESRQKRRA